MTSTRGTEETKRTKISLFKNCNICKQFADKHSHFWSSIQNEAFITLSHLQQLSML